MDEIDKALDALVETWGDCVPYVEYRGDDIVLDGHFTAQQIIDMARVLMRDGKMAGPDVFTMQKTGVGFWPYKVMYGEYEMFRAHRTFCEDALENLNLRSMAK